jgi:hypothetical protein
MRRALASLLAVFVAVGVPSAAAEFNSAAFSGYWTGRGTIISDGVSESIKCVARYSVTDGRLYHTLRCASPGLSVHAEASLRIDGGQVSGHFEEKSAAVRGVVSGRTTEDGLSLTIDGGAFSAAMSVRVEGCRQTLDVPPKNLAVSRISVRLEKC